MNPERGGAGSLGRSGLRFRVYLLVGIGVLAPTALLAWAGFTQMRDLDERLLAGREIAARAVAAHLDEELTIKLEVLQRAASRIDVGAATEDPTRKALHDTYLQFHFPGGLFILDATGRTILEEPARASRTAAPPPGTAQVLEVLRSGRPSITNIVPTSNGPRVYALVPVRDWHGAVVGIVGGLLDVTQAQFRATIAYLSRGRGGHSDVVDGNGVVLVSTDPARIHNLVECQGALSPFVRERRSAVMRCDGCHRERGVSRRTASILAVSPLTRASWGLAVVQPEQEVLASPGALSGSVIPFAILLLGLAGVFAWGAARSVTRPVAVLTDAAERIASGNLAQPIPQLGEDELGRLGLSLERMRRSLRDLIGIVESQNDALEKRVEERTRELEKLNEQLRAREDSRRELMRKLITAQEGERKRIARELHDDTSQSLAVLVMGLEAATAAIRSGGTPHLDEVKAVAVRTLEEIHRVIFDLRPSVLDDLGLLSAIRLYAERHLQSRGISVRCECGEIDRRIPPDFETALFRIAQEGMSNVMRHAQAEAVLIQVSQTGDELQIEIEDDGKGFDLTIPADGERPHYGLQGIRERAELLGGSARVDSAPGKGTHLVVKVPLPRKE